jgi:hypothetical protein
MEKKKEKRMFKKVSDKTKLIIKRVPHISKALRMPGLFADWKY